MLTNEQNVKFMDETLRIFALVHDQCTNDGYVPLAESDIYQDELFASFDDYVANHTNEKIDTLIEGYLANIDDDTKEEYAYDYDKRVQFYVVDQYMKRMRESVDEIAERIGADRDDVQEEVDEFIENEEDDNSEVETFADFITPMRSLLVKYVASK